MAQPVEQENVTENSPDGALFGRTSTKKLGFYGATPIARPVTGSSNNVSTATTNSLSTAGVAAATPWGFLNQTEIVNFTVAVSSMQYAMKQLGIMS
jgi:hypothetical protein